ncbi:5'-deoxynucleotidase YfbR [compost metagenome]
MEVIAADRLLHMTPSLLHGIYEALLKPDQDNMQEKVLYQYVKAADHLDAYLKCTLEVAAGNREFTVAKAQTYDNLLLLAMPEIDYFLQHMAPSFEMSLDELSQPPS